MKINSFPPLAIDSQKSQVHKSIQEKISLFVNDAIGIKTRQTSSFIDKVASGEVTLHMGRGIFSGERYFYTMKKADSLFSRFRRTIELKIRGNKHASTIHSTMQAITQLKKENIDQNSYYNDFLQKVDPLRQDLIGKIKNSSNAQEKAIFKTFHTTISHLSNKQNELLNLKKEQERNIRIFDPVLQKAQNLLKNIPLLSSFDRSEESDEKNDDFGTERKRNGLEEIEKENKKYFEEQLQEINKQKKPIVERFLIKNEPIHKEEESKVEFTPTNLFTFAAGFAEEVFNEFTKPTEVKKLREFPFKLQEPTVRENNKYIVRVQKNEEGTVKVLTNKTNGKRVEKFENSQKSETIIKKFHEGKKRPYEVMINRPKYVETQKKIKIKGYSGIEKVRKYKKSGKKVTLLQHKDKNGNKRIETRFRDEFDRLHIVREKHTPREQGIAVTRKTTIEDSINSFDLMMQKATNQ